MSERGLRRTFQRSMGETWRALRVLADRGLPTLEHTMRDNEVLLVECTIFVALSEPSDEEMRLSELADYANTSHSRLSHRMRRLVERGDVETRTSETDRRVVYASLTPSGRGRATPPVRLPR